jgi:hypothetical protein
MLFFLSVFAAGQRIGSTAWIFRPIGGRLIQLVTGITCGAGVAQDVKASCKATLDDYRNYAIVLNASRCLSPMLYFTKRSRGTPRLLIG